MTSHYEAVVSGGPSIGEEKISPQAKRCKPAGLS
jgi:hypothetical protein